MPPRDRRLTLSTPACTYRILNRMRLLEALATAFINTFGITQPTAATHRRAAWFILALLCLMVAVVTIAGLAFYHVLHM